MTLPGVHSPDILWAVIISCCVQISERSAGDAEGAGLLPHLRLREHGGGGECGSTGGDHLRSGQYADAGTPRQGEDTRPCSSGYVILHQIQVHKVDPDTVLCGYKNFRERIPILGPSHPDTTSDTHLR
jgi:hypothetical protein